MDLHRHQLAYLSPEGWQHVMSSTWSGDVRDCVAHWAAHRLPWVVTRQPDVLPVQPDRMALGLAAPVRWGKQRIGMIVERTHIERLDEFPLADRVTSLLPAHVQVQWQRLMLQLHAFDGVARAYGSHGWQVLTGLDHLRPQSDVDIWLRVHGPEHADGVVALLAQWNAHGDAACPVLDGELMFSNGAAVAWREWCTFRRAQTPRIMVKHQVGVELRDDEFWRDTALHATGRAR